MEDFFTFTDQELEEWLHQEGLANASMDELDYHLGLGNLSGSDANYSDHGSLVDLFGPGDFLQEDFPHPVKSTLILLYVLIIIVAVIGNFFVMLVVVKFNKMRTVTNVFLVSLAVSDMLIAGLNMPIQLRFLVQNEWTMGYGMCAFSNYIQGVVIVASILTLTGIAIDRFYAICYPLSARHVHTLTRANAACFLVIFWTTSFVLLVPQIFIMRLEPAIVLTKNNTDFEIAHICVEYFEEQWQHILYTLVIYIVLYVFPVVTMVVTYGCISCTLWRRQQIGETPDGQDANRRQREKKRIVRMLVVIVALFIINWFPFFTAQVYLLFHHPSGSFRVTMAFMQLFGYSNACTNPIVYCFMNGSFRQHLFKLICCKCFWRYNRRMRRRSSTSLQPVVTSNSTHMSLA